MGKKGKNSMVSLKCMLLGLTLCAALTLSAFGETARAAGEDPTSSLDVSLKNLKIGLLAYIEYSAGTKPMPKALDEDQGQNYNQFNVTRGYITIEKEIMPYFTARVTTDIFQETKDKGTSADGSYIVRLKYYYGQFKIPDLGPITSIKSEFGMGHIPWLDFEESINVYRAQGTMAVERAGVFSSADLGASVMGYFGGTLDDAKKKLGSDKYAGKFGSWHLGVYNGSGYNQIERNQNKVVEGRLTLRPLPMIDLLAGLQLSYFGLVGEGNKVYVDSNKDNVYPKYMTNLGMLSYQNPYVIFTGQYFQTVGNAKGDWVFTNKDGDPEALNTDGYSFFLNVRLPILDKKPAIFARYDYFNEDAGGDLKRVDGKDAKAAYTTALGGISYNFYKNNMIIASYEVTDYEDDASVKGNVPVVGANLGPDKKFQLIMQVTF